MVTVAAVVWRGGPVARGVTVGTAVGLLLGALAWLDSGSALTGAIVSVVVGACYGGWMQRRMVRYWPGADTLDGARRVAVARAARRGEPVTDPRLAGAVADYVRGLHAAADEARPYRWVVPLVLVVSIATAVWDAAFGSWGNAAVSAIYLVMLLIEVFWWPGRRRRLLAGADRSVSHAAQ